MKTDKIKLAYQQGYRAGKKAELKRIKNILMSKPSYGV